MVPKNINKTGAFCQSFPPLAARDARILIVGSMPGAASLAAQQYYAHKQNALWPILGVFFDADTGSYPARKKLVRDNNIALWDVLKHCTRHGSLDAAIRDAQLNDFMTFFKKHPHITHVLMNGTKAAAAFTRRVLPTLPAAVQQRLTCVAMPSTSPARAMKKGIKQKEWHAALRRSIG